MIETVADWIVYGIFGLSAESHLGSAVHFFFYDSLKIILLLFLISMLMGIINAYFPIDRLRQYLTHHKLYGLEYLLASVFGAITPFCSCSSIPLFIGFVKGGIPLGVTFAFLITSPLVNEVAVAMFAATFGWKITGIYVVSGVAMGMFGGWVLGKMKPERLLTPWVRHLQSQSESNAEKWEAEKLSFTKRLPTIIRDAWGIVRGVLLYILIGIAIGAGIHGFVPDEFFAQWMGNDAWYAVPVSVLLAVPMYANAAGIVPVVQVLVAKGVSIGSALAFMMAVVGLSLPEATMLKKVMTWKLIGIFFGVVTVSIIALGYFYQTIL